MSEEIQFAGGIANGKSFKQFLEFQKAVKSGKSVEYHAKDYVCMDRKHYEKITNLYNLIKKLNNQ